jgi:predicted permease
VVVISHSLWQRRFGSDPQIVGRLIRLDERQMAIVGVMPARMAAPLVFGLVDFWQPMGLTVPDRSYLEDIHIVARLSPRDSLAHANTVVRTIAARVARERPRAGVQRSLRVVSLHASSTDDTGRLLLLITVSLSGMVLLIACANLGNLQLARAVSRHRDYAVRVAMGATRMRLIRPMVIESSLLALFGGAGALLIAASGNHWFGARFKFWYGVGGQEFPIDWRVLLFTGGATLMTGLFFGTLPGWLTTRVNLSIALKDRGRGSTMSRAGRRFRHALVVAEFAFALVLLTGAGFLFHGISRFMRRDVGWKTDGLVYAAVAISETRYADKQKHLDFYERLRERAAALPGVEEVTAAWGLPLWSYWDLRLVYVDGGPAATPDQVPRAYYNGVTPGFFKTLGIALLDGRDFDRRDTGILYNDLNRDPNSIQVGIVNETMARTFWPRESAVGKRISFPGGLKREMFPIEIVGVVRDVRFASSLTPPVTRFQVYRPLEQEPWSFSVIIMRTSGAPRALLDTFRRALAEMDPNTPVAVSNTVADDIAAAMANLRLLLQLLSAVALLGLFLAALGIYAVIAQVVQHRTSEIGIRLALGAQTSDVLWLMVKNGLQMAGVGAGIGMVGVAALAYLLKRLVPEMPAADPWLAGTLTLILLAVALLACWLPARRAARVDPVVALRAE